MFFAIRQIAAAFNQSDARHVEARAIFVFKLISVSPARSGAHSISQSRVGSGQSYNVYIT